jgi:hypothetical protein
VPEVQPQKAKVKESVWVKVLDQAQDQLLGLAINLKEILVPTLMDSVSDKAKLLPLVQAMQTLQVRE